MCIYHVLLENKSLMCAGGARTTRVRHGTWRGSTRCRRTRRSSCHRRRSSVAPPPSGQTASKYPRRCRKYPRRCRKTFEGFSDITRRWGIERILFFIPTNRASYVCLQFQEKTGKIQMPMMLHYERFPLQRNNENTIKRPLKHLCQWNVLCV